MGSAAENYLERVDSPQFLRLLEHFVNDRDGLFSNDLISRPRQPVSLHDYVAHRSLAGRPVASLLWARRWSCPACTPTTQSYVAAGPTRGSHVTWASRKVCTYARSWSIRACI